MTQINKVYSVKKNPSTVYPSHSIDMNQCVIDVVMSKLPSQWHNASGDIQRDTMSCENKPYSTNTIINGFLLNHSFHIHSTFL